MNLNLIKADTNIFAVYQTMYSNADTNISYESYDWNSRLRDAKPWADHGYFLVLDGTKIGGAVIEDDSIQCPFLILPFVDRVQFWAYLLKLSPRKYLKGMSDVDNSILPMFGYRNMGSRQGMYRPADIIKMDLTAGYICRPLNVNTDAAAAGKVYVEGYTGGICFEKYGTETQDEAVVEIMRCLDYDAKDMSIVIIEIATNQMVGVCVAGIAKHHISGYSHIGDLAVLPQYQGKGLGKYMLSHIVTQTHGLAPFVRLFVDTGNNAEYLYRQMGFIAGPRYSDMERRN